MPRRSAGFGGAVNWLALCESFALSKRKETNKKPKKKQMKKRKSKKYVLKKKGNIKIQERIKKKSIQIYFY